MFNSTTTQFWTVWNLPFSVTKVLKFKSVLNVLLIFFLIFFFFHSSSFISSPLHPNTTLCSTWKYGCQHIENMKHESHPYESNVNMNSCKLAAKYFSCKRKKKGREREKKKACILVTFFTETNPFSSLTEMWKCGFAFHHEYFKHIWFLHVMIANVWSHLIKYMFNPSFLWEVLMRNWSLKLKQTHNQHI